VLQVVQELPLLHVEQPAGHLKHIPSD
jgi:hypothetical protein